jgi:acyl transferase domain-containing protein/3-hydroxymyristoyl/3-hydroxydecanoyl-(acyl carrier protein) dehydratase/1-acyl-sn-glycerol-3-phosphate acyltransferase
MKHSFEPIAIVGMGCILPGCHDVDALWDTVAAGRTQLTPAPQGDWRVSMERVLSAEPGPYEPDRAWSDMGGYVRGFEDVFDPASTLLDPQLVAQLDPVFQWSLYAAQGAMKGVSANADVAARAGVILGNLSYPTRAHNRLAEDEWLARLFGRALPADGGVHAMNRFMSGLPPMVVARGLGLGGDTLALDAACASSLYAIKLACDRLQDGRADLMLAGAVNAADQLFLHVGFSALHALSRSGQSRPFHRDADGLLPAEGAAFVALKRVADAQAAGDTILGVIRGVGLSNDGRSGGFLSPSRAGQERSMRDALAQAGIAPRDVQYVECHATGTSVGDATEIASLTGVYGDCPGLAIGSLKANLGHLITASGVAGLIKVLAAMRHAQIPATPGARPLAGALDATGFTVPEEALDWTAAHGQRTAAVSSFGFGGNNAHLIVQQAPAPVPVVPTAVAPDADPTADIVVVGLGVRTHLDASADAFARRVLGGAATELPGDDVALAARQLAFPPADLRQALGQQLILLDVLDQALGQGGAPLSGVDAARTGVYVGMQTDSEICTYGLRWRLPDRLRQAGLAPDAAWLQAARQILPGPLDAAGVIGKMPNICANRLSNQLDLRGPGFAVSREELSGDAALELAYTAIRRGEIDAALVAAVDLCRETVHSASISQMGTDMATVPPADAAVMVLLKSRAQAVRDGDIILAVLSAAAPPADAAVPVVRNDVASPLHKLLGHAHAASGLLHVALGVQMLQSRAYLDAAGQPQPLLAGARSRRVAVDNAAAFGEHAHWLLAEAPSPARTLALRQPPQLESYAAHDRAALLARLQGGQPGGEGPCRLAIVAETPALAAARTRALQLLASGQMGAAWSVEGISFRAAPIEGELACAFTGAAAAYPGMGRDLLLGMPDLVDRLAPRLHDMAAAVGWAYAADDGRAGQPYHQLAGCSFLCQLHMQLGRDVLGLKPTAAIGLSSGETNAMFAFGAWRDVDGLLEDIRESGLYSHALACSFDAVRTHWQLGPDAVVDWDNLRVRAAVDDVRAAVAAVGRVYITIVNSPTDVVIGGDRLACQDVLTALGNPPAVALGHDLAIHCEAVLPFASAWRRLHTRTVHPVAGVRFYGNYFGAAYAPTEDSVAEALTGQALQTVDFPQLIERAWQDGVRIFVEHGPRNGLSSAIDEILAGRNHLAVAFDRPGVPALTQACRAAAQLWCAGADVDLARLKGLAACATVPKAGAAAARIRFPLRPPPVQLPLSMPLPVAAAALLAAGETGVYVPPELHAVADAGRLMVAAPPLRRLVAPANAPASAMVQVPVPQSATAIVKVSVPASESASASMKPSMPAVVPAPAVLSTPNPATGALSLLVAGHRQMVEAHQLYLSAQGQAQQAFTVSMARVQAALLGAAPAAASSFAASADPVPAPSPAPAPASAIQAAAAGPVPAAAQPVPVQAPPAAARFPGPAFSREQLEVLAGGTISSVFGPAFQGQDGYAVQVRMPQPPLLLCDRVLGIEGAAHSMGQGTIWTETDVRAASWYLHHGRMPAGIFIESGQADLLLVSWLGIDAHNRGERAYRLLGCDLVFHGDLPAPGDTLHYEISVDGHARQGDVRLFFFHYDCRVNGELRLSVRNGQAGFFSPQDLAGSAGVIWQPETAPYAAGATAAPGDIATRKTCFSHQEVAAYLDGDLVACFGEDFFWADTHTRTPRSQAGRHNFMGEVTQLDFNGGPAGRGYLRVETAVMPDAWFFDGHFKNDPCMPGTLMADACLQAMGFYLAATGRTLRRDGWRFKPAAGQDYRFKCRGQVTPQAQRIVYELFVDEIVDGLTPVLYAHVLATVDGRKAFLCERLGLQLVPDWPLTSMPEALPGRRDERPLAHIGAFPLDYRSLIHCAWGQPSLAFGAGFAQYDGGRRSPRLPAPPYHFMTRITELHGQMADMKPGARVIAVYDIEPEAWYFTQNVGATMPSCVLMEVALQPCGWLASYTLSRPASERELLFRNLDGESVQAREITPADSTITTEVTLLSVSQVGDLIIEKFSVRCTVGAEEVFRVDTVFGFFPPAAMVNQKGFATTPESVARLNQTCDVQIDLAPRPAHLFGGPNQGRDNLRLPGGMLLMIDRITGYWPQGGAARLGAIRTEKDVNPRDWFFKAHFFQDPVQPGSLGVEAMLQSIQAWMLLQDLDAGIAHPRFEPIDIGGQTEWHYRGQITPDRTRISVEFEATAVERDARGVLATGIARLWIDGLQIYQAPRIGVRIVAGPVPGPDPDTLEIPWSTDLDDPQHAWLRDHCPTHTLPALPLACELDMMAAAAARMFGGRMLAAIDRGEARQWLVFPQALVAGVTSVTRVDGDACDVALRFEQGGEWATAATARLRFAAPGAPGTPGTPGAVPTLMPLAPLAAPVHITDPYAHCGLFHGPALQLMRDLVVGANGAQATVARGGHVLPRGVLNPGLLDAALHCIPHDDFTVWCKDVAPARLPGTLATVYRASPSDADLARVVAVKDHLAAHLRLHPGEIAVDAEGRCANLPLNQLAVSVVDDAGDVVARSTAPAALDDGFLRRDWAVRMPDSAAFVRDLGLALIGRFVRRVVLADPAGHAALRGRPVLYLANHQTAIESFLFLAIATSLSDLPAGAIAKDEHRHTWIGAIHVLADQSMGARNPLRMLFFDRANQADMLRLLKEYGAALAQDPYSLLVHVDGTRAQEAGAPVRTVSSVLIDLALKHGLPIVPVRFAGGLATTGNAERLEFPHNLGQQDYFIGAAILPATLEALPYARRAQLVADAINRLGPGGGADVPLAGDPLFREAVRKSVAGGRDAHQAVLHSALEGAGGPVPDHVATSAAEGLAARLVGVSRDAGN